MTASREEEILAQLLPTFRQEAQEHARHVAAVLAEHERNPAPQLVEEGFRAVHSLKGAARAVGLRQIEALCQDMEEIFSLWSRKSIVPSHDLYKLLYAGVDVIEQVAGSVSGRLSPADEEALEGVRQRIGEARNRDGAVAPEPAVSVEPAPVGTAQESEQRETLVRVASQRLETLLAQGEELIPEKQAALQRIEEIQELTASLASLHKATTATLVDVRRNGGADAETQASRLTAFLEWCDGFSRDLEKRFRRHADRIRSDTRSLGGKLDAILWEMRDILMLPVGTILAGLPRMARELARQAGKEVEVVLSGEQILLDRRILEGLREPLIHILRNAVDHGIEPPEKRKAAGKPVRGRIAVTATARDVNEVVLSVQDDGEGQDPAAIREAAVAGGELSPAEAEAMSDEEVLFLLFRSGFSTKAAVTEVSGHGLGLAIVRDEVEKLGGEVTFSSRRGAGTLISLLLPSAVAAFRGVLVAEDGRPYVFPAMAVERVVNLKRDQPTVVGNRDAVIISGEVLPLVRLGQVLGRRQSGPLPETIPVLLVNSDRGITAFRVDQVLFEQEFLVKELGPQLVHVRGISGAAVLGNGEIALILSPDELLEAAPVPATGVPAAASGQPKPSLSHILVVEDSITSRTLLKNILESAGFAVTTAVDGIDGLTRFRSGRYNAVISDIEMPRMNGFELTEQLRKSNPSVPIILVTTLDAPEYRRRGLDAGADAYIVKSTFDQEDLLEAVRRLL